MHFIQIALFFMSLLKAFNSRVIFVASVFRHGERLSYINFRENKRNNTTLTMKGKASSYQAGKTFLESLSLEANSQFINRSSMICYEGKRARTIETLSFRLGGMLSIPFEQLLNQTSYHNFSEANCNLRGDTVNLFPQKALTDSVLLSFNKEFTQYANGLLHSLKDNTLFSKYLNSDIYYQGSGNESVYYKLNLINDYFTFNEGKAADLHEEEIKKTLRGYQQKYFNALLKSNRSVEVMVAKFFQILITEIENTLNRKSNQIQLMLFSSQEFSIVSLIHSLEIIAEDRPKTIAFNDELSFALVEDNEDLCIVLYYNHKRIKMAQCDANCLLSYFTNVIIHPYLPKRDDQLKSQSKGSTVNDEL